ncbi:MAG: DUF2269 domain-containing protein [Nitriliruptorales bacterium]
MGPRLRKTALTAHVTSSVGWLGAVAAFLALAIVGWTSQDAETVRGAYLVMEPAAWVVLVPLSLASLLTGLVSSLGTTWGLFRHYWVLFKLLINVVATIVLLLYLPTFRFMASLAADPSTELGVVRSPSPALHAALALLLLLVATVLGVFKPRGMTGYGRRRVDAQRRPRGGGAGAPLGMRGQVRPRPDPERVVAGIRSGAPPWALVRRAGGED